MNPKSGPSEFHYAMPTTENEVVQLVSTGVRVGEGDPRPLGVTPESATNVCDGMRGGEDV